MWWEPVYIAKYHEETEPWDVRQIMAFAEVVDGFGALEVYLGAQEQRAVGHHWVYIYDQQWRKLADLQYQVVP